MLYTLDSLDEPLKKKLFHSVLRFNFFYFLADTLKLNCLKHSVMGVAVSPILLYNKDRIVMRRLFEIV